MQGDGEQAVERNFDSGGILTAQGSGGNWLKTCLNLFFRLLLSEVEVGVL